MLFHLLDRYVDSYTYLGMLYYNSCYLKNILTIIL